MSQESNDELIEQLKKDIELWEEQEIEFMGEFPQNGHELTKEIAAFATSCTHFGNCIPNRVSILFKTYSSEFSTASRLRFQASMIILLA